MSSMIGARNLERETESLSCSVSIASKLWRASDETLLSKEQEHTRYSLQKWQEIEDCKSMIQHYQRKLQVLAIELQDLSLCTRVAYDPSLWYHLPDAQKNNKEVVLAMLQGTPAKTNVPEVLYPFQEMLWSDPSCHLLNDREILLASLEREMPPPAHFQVLLSEEMLEDSELICKLTTKHPWYLYQDDVPAAVFDDADVFRALLGVVALLSKSDEDFLLPKFSPRLRNDADLMLEAILAICNADIRYPYNDPIVGERLRDNKPFCLRLTDALLLPHEGCRPQNCPLKLEHVSQRLTLDPEVVSAFCRVDGFNLIFALNMQGASPQRLLFEPPLSKESVLKFLKDEAYEYHPFDVLTFYHDLPLEFLHDMDVAVAVSLHEGVDIYGNAHFQEFWWHDRDYWCHLAEACTHGFFFDEYWGSLPLELQQDRGLALFVAQKAQFRSGDAVSSVRRLFAKFPDFLSDRVVVANLVKQLISDELLAQFVEMIPREVFQKDFCIELLQIKTDFYVYLPVDLRGDREIVKALCSHYRWAFPFPRKPLSLLPQDIQLRHPDLVAEMIRNTQKDTIDDNEIAEVLRSNNRDVVLALISIGCRVQPSLLSQELCNDRDVFLAFAEHQVRGFRACPTFLRRDKEFMLQVAKKNPVCLEYLDESLEGDFDIFLAAFSSDQDHARHFEYRGDVAECRAQRLATFARKVRERLQTFLAFSSFLEGMRTTSCALSLLDEGTETAVGYKKLIASYAGIPLGDELCMLRRASVGLTRWGY